MHNSKSKLKAKTEGKSEFQLKVRYRLDTLEKALLAKADFPLNTRRERGRRSSIHPRQVASERDDAMQARPNCIETARKEALS